MDCRAYGELGPSFSACSSDLLCSPSLSGQTGNVWTHLVGLIIFLLLFVRDVVLSTQDTHHRLVTVRPLRLLSPPRNGVHHRLITVLITVNMTLPGEVTHRAVPAPRERSIPALLSVT